MGRVASSPPSDCHVAALLLPFVVSAPLPHHAVREDAASPSKPRDPPKRPSRHYLRLHRCPRPGDGTSGGTGPNRPCSEPLFLSRGCFPAPAECGAVHPHPVKDHRQLAGKGHLRSPHAASLGHLHGPALERKEPHPPRKHDVRTALVQ